MGVAHFDMMFEDALEVDKRALLTAVNLFEEGRVCAMCKDTPSLWSYMPFDQIVHVARGLLPLQDEFTANLQDMLVTGRLRVKLPTSRGPQEVRDPAYFTFDEPDIPMEAFTHLLMEFPQ